MIYRPETKARAYVHMIHKSNEKWVCSDYKKKGTNQGEEVRKIGTHLAGLNVDEDNG